MCRDGGLARSVRDSELLARLTATSVSSTHAVADLRNVIVFALGGSRWAAEIRHVREVAALGFVTVVPTAPPGIAGVFNLRGTIVPVLDVLALVGQAPHLPPRQGDGALIVEVDGAIAALRVDNVDEVASCPIGNQGDKVLDGRGREVTLVDPGVLLRRALVAAQAVRALDQADADADMTLDGWNKPTDTLGVNVDPTDFDGDSTLG
jgi:chemotaxis signal transduction protein